MVSVVGLAVGRLRSEEKAKTMVRSESLEDEEGNECGEGGRQKKVTLDKWVILGFNT